MGGLAAGSGLSISCMGHASVLVVVGACGDDGCDVLLPRRRATGTAQEGETPTHVSPSMLVSDFYIYILYIYIYMCVCVCVVYTYLEICLSMRCVFNFVSPPVGARRPPRGGGGGGGGGG
jgi:hypothetical protein